MTRLAPLADEARWPVAVMAERRGGVSAFLVYGDRHGIQRTFVIDAASERARIGRGTGVELRLSWDREVSRVHAELYRVGDAWVLTDDGLSANGTYVNGERVRGRRRLASGDRIRVGRTPLVFRALSDEGSSTFVPAQARPPVELSRMQRKVLVALSLPSRTGSTPGVPATNQQIADELSISVDAVKTHLRALFGKFEISGLAQNQKRARLVKLAIDRGNLSAEDLVSEVQP